MNRKQIQAEAARLEAVYAGIRAELAASNTSANRERARWAGLNISVYQVEIEHVSMARHQCIFNRALAHKTDTLDIVDFFARGCGLPEVERDDQRYVRRLTMPAVALFVAQRATENRLAKSAADGKE